MFPRKRRGFPFPWDDDFESIFEEMEEFMREVMDKMEKGEKPGSYVYGFNIKWGPDGKVKIEEFGNKPTVNGDIKNEREPLTDIMESKDEITVIAELPGVNKEDIQLTVNDRELVIKVDKEDRKYYKRLRLPAEVKTDSAKAHYNNGILEVKLKKIEKKSGGKSIKIE